eukprot:scaffold8277_cov157-Isochrysis_galbana.AAC.5
MQPLKRPGSSLPHVHLTPPASALALPPSPLLPALAGLTRPLASVVACDRIVSPPPTGPPPPPPHRPSGPRMVAAGWQGRRRRRRLGAIMDSARHRCGGHRIPFHGPRTSHGTRA